MVRAIDPGAAYRAIYLTLWRMQERHDRRTARPACNDALSHCIDCNEWVRGACAFHACPFRQPRHDAAGNGAELFRGD